MVQTDMQQRFSIIRYVLATPEDVWHAWTAPQAIAQWWHLPNTTTPREELEYDVQVGGSYIYTSIDNETHKRLVSGGTFQEVSPPERLVFTWGAPGFDPEDLPVVRVLIEEIDDGCYVTFELKGVSGEPGDGAFYDTWDNALTSLKEYASKAPTS